MPSVKDLSYPSTYVDQDGKIQPCLKIRGVAEEPDPVKKRALVDAFIKALEEERKK
jgi:hypothetical protein